MHVYMCVVGVQAELQLLSGPSWSQDSAGLPKYSLQPTIITTWPQSVLQRDRLFICCDPFRHCLPFTS